MITSDILTKIVRPGLIPIGYIMNIAGKIIKDQRIELLGHYLTCSGKDYVLDHTKLATEIVNGYPKDTRIYDSNDKDIYITCFQDRHLDQILGKFYLFDKNNNKFQIADRYKFYPWDGGYNSFAGEENEEWNQITFTIRLDFVNKSKFLCNLIRRLVRDDPLFDKYLILEEDLRSSWNKLEHLSIRVSEYVVSLCIIGFELYIGESKFLNIGISDKLFYFLGKPFNVVTEEFSFPEEFYSIWHKATNKGDKNGSKVSMGNNVSNNYEPI